MQTHTRTQMLNTKQRKKEREKKTEVHTNEHGHLMEIQQVWCGIV